MAKALLKEPPTSFDFNQTDSAVHVLHVDDEIGLLNTTKQILELQGNFKVTSVSSVKEGLQKLQEKHSSTYT